MNVRPAPTGRLPIWLLLIGTLLAAGGCAEPELSAEALQAIEARAAELAETLADRPGTRADGIVVSLAFEEDVDLDLYVTDPLLETVYFARHETRTGGTIGADVRCDSMLPVKEVRVEEIRFPDPWPGRYRVGVDFPTRCDGSRSRVPAPYAVSVMANGVLHETHGLVNLEFFEVVVLEFDVAESSLDRGES